MQLLVSGPRNARSACMLLWEHSFTDTALSLPKTMTEITGLTFLQLTPKAGL